MAFLYCSNRLLSLLFRFRVCESSSERIIAVYAKLMYESTLLALDVKLAAAVAMALGSIFTRRRKPEDISGFAVLGLGFVSYGLLTASLLFTILARAFITYRRGQLSILDF